MSLIYCDIKLFVHGEFVKDMHLFIYTCRKCTVTCL